MVYRVWKLVAVTKTIIATVIKIVIIAMWKKFIFKIWIKVKKKRKEK